jgi:hypothetical protein
MGQLLFLIHFFTYKAWFLEFNAASSFRFFIGYWILNEAGFLSGFFYAKEYKY